MSTYLQVLCVASVNQAAFLSDCSKALQIVKGSELASSDEKSMSLVWVCTGTENLTKVVNTSTCTYCSVYTYTHIIDTFMYMNIDTYMLCYVLGEYT